MLVDGDAHDGGPGGAGLLSLSAELLSDRDPLVGQQVRAADQDRASLRLRANTEAVESVEVLRILDG